MSEVAKALREAADYIERHGWLQGNGQTFAHGKPCCAQVALQLVTPNDESGLLIYQKAQAALHRHVRGWVTGWNDTPGRTVTEVLSALRSAADEVGRG